MRIGIFSDCYLPTRNGVSTVIAQARDELLRRGHSVSVFTVAGSDDPELCDGRAPVHRVPSLPFNRQIQVRLGLPWQRRLDECVDREELDIIHTHTEFSLGRAGQAAASAANLPLVHTLHTYYPAYRHYAPFGRFLPLRAVDSLLAAFLRRCDVVVCPSEKGQLYAASCAPESATTVIPNGIAPGRFCPRHLMKDARAAARIYLGIAPNATVVLFAGRLAPEKRVTQLLWALHPLLAADAALQAVFAGVGTQARDLAAQARSLCIGERVLLTGSVPWHDMPRLYALADVFATASLSEIHPMTSIEAVSSGLPVIARRDPCMDGLVLDGFNGFLVDSDADITARLAALLYDENTRHELGRNAASVAAGLTIGAHVDRLEALYRQLIATHSRKAVG